MRIPGVRGATASLAIATVLMGIASARPARATQDSERTHADALERAGESVIGEISRRNSAELSVSAASLRVTDASAPVVIRTSQTGRIFKECDHCPAMVVMPGGAFLIGSPESEPGRGADEAPRRRIEFRYGFAVSRNEITRGEYEDFVASTGHAVKGNCVTDRVQTGTWTADVATTLRDPGFSQADNHPVACVSWIDAQAYVAWINRQSKGGYRLLSESEWEFAARAGTTTAYPWGATPAGGCRFGNIGDARAAAKYPGLPWADCNDGALNTAPVGTYLPNAFGLFDLIGNVGEWVDDCGTTSYASLPSTGEPDHSEPCDKRIVRGGSWGTMVKDFRVANRMRYRPDDRDDSIGIRLARTLE